ncbi:hypothetical protein [Antarctobacter jejuensis]|uniref:hypothetical protein n=1 Tax=Antarctobacter jejuensis TaxID=1439938 RepID=UPI003FCF044A
MRFKAMAMIASGLLIAACAQQEEEVGVYYPVTLDKYGNVVGGTIVDGNFVLPDGTVAGPVSPSVTDDNRDRDQSRDRAQAQAQQNVQSRSRGN